MNPFLYNKIVLRLEIQFLDRITARQLGNKFAKENGFSIIQLNAYSYKEWYVRYSF